jgi:hypothetical protein
VKRIYVIAGEASGDLHGANLINNLKTHAKEPIQIYGIGGDKIRATGAYGFYDLAHFHVTGLTDAIRKLPQYKAASKSILAKIKNIRPELVVLIDNPGFNLHLAEKLTAMGIPCVYYIAPQLWAWNPKRIDFEDQVSTGTDASPQSISFNHSFGGRVRWWIVDAYSTGSIVLPLVLKDNTLTTANTLVLNVYYPMTFTLRVEEAG